jgi:hypothetical protein
MLPPGRLPEARPLRCTLADPVGELLRAECCSFFLGVLLFSPRHGTSPMYPQIAGMEVCGLPCPEAVCVGPPLTGRPRLQSANCPGKCYLLPDFLLPWPLSCLRTDRGWAGSERDLRNGGFAWRRRHRCHRHRHSFSQPSPCSKVGLGGSLFLLRAAQLGATAVRASVRAPALLLVSVCSD